MRKRIANITAQQGELALAGEPMKRRVVFALLALLVGATALACPPSPQVWEHEHWQGYQRHTVGWSPQGHIVFSDGGHWRRSIYAVRDDGSLLTAIQESDQDTTNISPEVSPDGSEIAYAKYKEDGWFGLGGTNNWDIFTTRIDGSHTRRLAGYKGADSNPIWSTDGERILFSSINCTPSVDASTLCIMNADGSGVRALPWNYIGTNPWASWSPDGRRLALFGQPPDISPEYMLYVAMADGSDLTRIMQTGEPVATPSWSPDGNYLVFISAMDRSVHISSADGEIVRKIGDSRPSDQALWSQALWSPNGAEILIHTGRSNANVRIVSPKGLLLSSWPIFRKRILNGDYFYPSGSIVSAWSPDGSQIAFSGGGGTVWTANRDGTDFRFLVVSGKLVTWRWAQ